MKNIITLSISAPTSFIINKFATADITIKKIIASNKSVIIEILESHLKIAQSVLAQNNIPYEQLGIRGTKNSYMRALGMYGMILGIMISIVLSAVYSFSITKININGNKLVSDQLILDTLKELNIDYPSFSKSRIDIDKIEQTLVNVSGISSASVHIKGSVLVVDILEELKYNEVIDVTDPTPVVALKDSIVTRIVTLQGTPLVKVGSTVKKGQELIAPYRLLYDDIKAPIKAVGEVYGRVWYSKHLVYYDTIYTKVRTGESTTITSVEVFGMRKKASSPYSSFQEEESVSVIKGVVPIKVYRQTFFETEDREVSFDFEQNCQILVEENLLRLKNSVNSSAKEIRSWYFVKRVDKSTILDIYYEVEEQIN